MKHLLASALLSLICFAANAEWKSFASSPEFEIFVEDTSVKVSGATVSLWVKWSYAVNKTHLSYTYRTLVQYQSFQCVENETRITYTSLYPTADGSGTSVLNQNTRDELWRPILPNTYESQLKAWACR